MKSKSSVPIPQESDSILEMSHVKKSFGSNTVLNDISLSLSKGENLVVMGRSGCGKSVLIKCLVGLIYPDNGAIKVLGKTIQDLESKELNELRKKIGFLFQSGALYDSMNVMENLLFPLREDKKTTQAKKIQLVKIALKNVGLEDTLSKMPSELSGGMRKRLGLARTLMLKPEIMLYDEPTTGLDPITSKEISELMLQVQKEYNTSSIIITHDIACARLTANRILILDSGSIQAEGTIKELESSKVALVKAFFE
ncbi:MAG: ABC transporter ATP-binding protein [Bacteroidetes bacterium B1(2017)]|nr:MAG: ABC transporter ATP-binding protein [Bacteroidetes bacterium B1(2017)]